jgi:hypothetical protein
MMVQFLGIMECWNTGWEHPGSYPMITQYSTIESTPKICFLLHGVTQTCPPYLSIKAGGEDTENHRGLIVSLLLHGPLRLFCGSLCNFIFRSGLSIPLFHYSRIPENRNHLQ